MTAERSQVLELLAELSDLHPEMRIGQWLSLFASLARDAQVESLYEVEDEELIPVMREFLQKRRAEAAAQSGAE
jgi:hypothetical protein